MRVNFGSENSVLWSAVEEKKGLVRISQCFLMVIWGGKNGFDVLSGGRGDQDQ